MIQSEKLYLSKLSVAILDLYRSIYMDKNQTQYVCSMLKNTQVNKYFNQSLLQSQKITPEYIVYIIRVKTTDESIGIIGLLWYQVSYEAVEIGVIITAPH